ncbi:e181bc7b-542c-4c47-ba07-1d9f88e26594 [Thermothielavioides terrestris]|uniref:E181bc7b-542c-4c47-ba07-1d9f88e26594 n=1 Tax=Thermothielavioides terrestris TaxID=2587410 RepID=A0A446BA89_9PEZI|nr:e181bc7b-542c-4c47-ba07-1d9f88e26594 [Thermothielavioides terrestris]
MSTPSRGIGKQ